MRRAKRTLTISVLLITVSVVLAQWPAAPGAVAEQNEFGQVDYSQRTVTATGIGAVPTNAPNVWAARANAMRAAKLDALRALIERFYPGRWEHIRPPSPEEIASVRVFRLPIEEVSAKIRTGQPTPYKEDFGMPVWAGIVPVAFKLGTPETDPNTPAETPVQDLAELARIVEATIAID